MKRCPQGALAAVVLLSLSPLVSAGDDFPPPGVPFARTEARISENAFQARAQASGADGWSSTNTWGRAGRWAWADASVRHSNLDGAWSNSAGYRGAWGDTNHAFSMTRDGDTMTISRSFSNSMGAETSTWTSTLPKRGHVGDTLNSARGRFR